MLPALGTLHWAFTFRSPGPQDNRPWQMPAGQAGVEIITKGRTWIADAQGERQWCGVGHVSVHGPQVSSLYHVDSYDPYHVTALLFKDTSLADGQSLHFAWSQPDAAVAFAADMMIAVHGQMSDTTLRSTYAHAQLAWEYQRAWMARDRPGLPTMVRNVVDYIERHYQQPITIADLAGVAGCSTSYVHVLFQRYVGRTPLAEITERRLRAVAMKLVHNPQQSVRQIGQACGFPDPVHVSRCFRRRYGCTPLAYRRAHHHNPLVFDG